MTAVPTDFTRKLLLVAVLQAALAACAPAAAPTLTATPTLVPSDTPSATPDIQVFVDMTLTAIAPTATGTPSTTPEFTEEPPIRVTLPPTLGEGIEPPITISLPTGWAVMQNDTLLLADVDTIRGIPFVAYSGPITGGTGTIVLLWGFPSLIDPFPEETGTPSTAPSVWADGLRLLRLAVVEQACNVGTDLQRTYRVGVLSAVGTQFAAVDCPELPDTRGWFAGLQERGLNFIFYAYADPITAMDTGQNELQAILDTVVFHVPEATPGT